MKTIILWINISMLIVFSSIDISAQQQYDPTAITQEIDYRIDELGDARMELRQKMTAIQWQNFKVSAVARKILLFSSATWNGA